MTIRYLQTVCLACNREPGVPLCPLCAAIMDAEEEAERRETAKSAEAKK